MCSGHRLDSPVIEDEPKTPSWPMASIQTIGNTDKWNKQRGWLALLPHISSRWYMITTQDHQKLPEIL